MSKAFTSSKTGSAAHPGLPGRDYHSPEIYELEKERIFFRNWFCIGREEQLSNAGDFLTEEVAGESLIAARTREKVQQGIGSRGYDRGFYPREDRFLRDFAERYLAERGPA